MTTSYFTFYREQNVTPSVFAPPSLNKTEQIVFSLIKNNPKITRSEISIKVSKTIRTVQRITNKLVDKGFLIRIGNNQYGYWEILNHKD